MSRADDAAFPRSYSEQQPGDRLEPCYAQEGATLREYFAAQALIGVLACNREISPREAAAEAVACADRLLEQLAKPLRPKSPTDEP